MKQILFIRGGEAFDHPDDYYQYLQTSPIDPFSKKKSWRDWIAWALHEEYDMIVPMMPCKQNAQYNAWKIWFERHFDFLNNEALILIGHSLGGTFLLKRLSENTFPKKITQLHLVCPVIVSEGLVGEGMGDFVLELPKLSRIEKQCEKMYLYHSKDDPVVPYEHSQILLSWLPRLDFFSFEKRGHFNQPALPELLNNIGYYND